MAIWSWLRLSSRGIKLQKGILYFLWKNNYVNTDERL
jgi:hypothetical protein